MSLHYSNLMNIYDKPCPGKHLMGSLTVTCRLGNPVASLKAQRLTRLGGRLQAHYRRINEIHSQQMPENCIDKTYSELQGTQRATRSTEYYKSRCNKAMRPIMRYETLHDKAIRLMTSDKPHSVTKHWDLWWATRPDVTKLRGSSWATRFSVSQNYKIYDMLLDSQRAVPQCLTHLQRMIHGS